MEFLQVNEIRRFVNMAGFIDETSVMEDMGK